METQKFIEEFIKLEPKSRNAQLALLDLIHWRVQSDSLKPQDLASACKEYFDRNKNKLYCSSDLRKYLPILDKANLLQVLEHTSKGLENENNEQEVRSPNLEHFMIIS